MKPTIFSNKLLYPALVVFCLTFAAFIFLNGKSKVGIPELKQRAGALANAPEWAETQITYEALLAELNKKPDDPKTTLQLAKTFMNEGRATGDFSYYNASALELIEKVLGNDPKHFEATCLKSMIFLSQHRFAEGKEIAETALKLNPYNSFVYGLLVDAYVELGEYEQAVEMCDRMVNIRPDIRSYSRVSYLRELHGDRDGAIQAIQQAIAAGVNGREETEWARMVLAHLYEDNNLPDRAREQYEISLQKRPDYPFALAGLAKLESQQNNLPAAIQYYEKAAEVMSEAAFYTELAGCYAKNGQAEKAENCLRATVAALKNNQATGEAATAAHNSDFELANLYLGAGQPQLALPYAQEEYKRRPKNIDACEVLAWSLYQSGKTNEAKPYIESALRTGSQKPERLVRAGVILAAAGEQLKGQELIKKGLSFKPYLDAKLATEAHSFIQN
ncbi:MAG: tetratricopeptide repeat protein [Saprospiraceae bacterium]|nr:tetratricopeptide repeat protein [Saprospiraceae bacterium]